MAYRLSSILLAGMLVSACSCSRQGPPPQRIAHSTNFVVVAGIDANKLVGEHVLGVLSQAGITGWVSGSVVWGIYVPSDLKTQAADVIERDAATNKHRLFFLER